MMTMAASCVCRDGQCMGVVLTLMLLFHTLVIQAAPAYITRPRREPPCTHSTHATLCWTVELKCPLHFQVTPASIETQSLQDSASSSLLQRLSQSLDSLHPKWLTTNSVHVLINNNQTSQFRGDGDFHAGSETLLFQPPSEFSSGISSSSGRSESRRNGPSTTQTEKVGSKVTVTPSSPVSSLQSKQHDRSDQTPSVSEKTSDDAFLVTHPAEPDSHSEIPRLQKEYVYHQMALQLADEVGLTLLGKVGELYDHFVLCYDKEGVRKAKSRQSRPETFTESGRSFQVFHKAHTDFMKSDAVTFEEIRDQVETALHRHQDVAWFTMETVHRRQKRSLDFNDPAFPHQWHLVNHEEIGMDINVTGVWEKGVTGKGVTVAVVDDGLEWSNPDLHNNYNFVGSWDLNDNDPDPMPSGSKASNHHGTRCAGEIAAVANNKVCGVGVAYGAKVSGIRVLDGPMTDSLEAEAFNKKFDVNAVYSCSWGPDDDGKTVDGPHILAAKAMKYGIEFGRHGYGSIFVVASGNGGSKQDNCNYDGYANSIYTVTIGAVDESGAMPFYAEECASMLGVTFSSGIASKRDIVTTDWRQKGSTGCTDRHTGTSASAPLVAGMIALTLEAQPCLTWRDVQYIIIITSVKVDRDLAHWQRNGAGLEHSHKHGFGLISAWRMVNAARVWRSVPWMTSYSNEDTGGWSIPHGAHNPLIISRTVTLKDIAGYSLYMLEYVQVTVTLTHPFRGKLNIHLRCPSGTNSVIGAPRPHDNSTDGFKDWTFTTVRCWGEAPTGNWTLTIADTLPPDGAFPTGYLSKWRLTLFGTPMTTNEFQERRKEVEMAMNGDHLTTNFTPPCDPPPVTSPPYIPFSEKTLKIVFLASVFCVVFALYETMEYMLCYGEEKRQQAEEEQRARNQMRANPNGMSPETTRLLNDAAEPDMDWLRHSQSAFLEENDADEDDMFLLDAGIATQMRQSRNNMGRQNTPAAAAAGERIPMSTFRSQPRHTPTNENQDDSQNVSQTFPSASAAERSFEVGASRTPSSLSNGISAAESGPTPPATESHPDGRPMKKTVTKDSILPTMWRALTRDGESDSDSHDELFSRDSESSVSLLHSDAKKSYR